MTKEEIRYLVLGDIHLGHPRNKTFSIVNAMIDFLKQYQSRTDLDILFLAGDVFHRLLDMTTEDFPEVAVWITRLFEYCARTNTKLRVLEGTPSHDWGQSRLFETLLSVSQLNVDLKYIDTLYIEHMEDLDLRILYVPDEWNPSTDKTFEQVQSLMGELGLTQVDIAIMHGAFAYQLPQQAIKSPKHNERSYLDIVKHYISVGHIHTFSVYERIIAEGSFDRLAHGEEEAKGAVEFVIRQNGNDEYYFIENKLAKIFKTITLKNRDLDASVKTITKQTKNLPTDSMVRLRASKDHPAIIGFDQLKKLFPFFVLSKITIEEEQELLTHDLITEVCADESTYIPITITPDNIKALLFDEVRSRYPFNEKQWSIAERTFNEAL